MRKDFELLKMRLGALSVYKNVVADGGIGALVNMISAENGQQCAKGFSEYFSALAERGLEGDSGKYIYGIVAADDNPFSRAATKKELSGSLSAAVCRELETLQMLADLAPDDFSQFFGGSIPDYLPLWKTKKIKLDINELADSYRKNGYGIFAQSAAFNFNSVTKKLEPIKSVSGVRLSDLKQYEDEKAAVLDNSLSFVKGLPANNVLLYGDRGTGKSSTVHAVLNELKGEGLRLVEANKAAIPHFPLLLSLLAEVNFKFIIFIDDLTFIDGADDYACLKAALEGSVGSKVGNVLIYATTNRRHLLKESAADRKGDDMRAGDTMQEQLSLSDRFGLVVTYINPGKKEFIDILTQILTDRKIKIDPRRLELEAERYALNKGGRSPRAAKQLADMLESKLARNLF